MNPGVDLSPSKEPTTENGSSGDSTGPQITTSHPGLVKLLSVGAFSWLCTVPIGYSGRAGYSDLNPNGTIFFYKKKKPILFG